MSSTNRGGKRSPSDYYPTPRWCVARLLEVAPLPGGNWLEPCVGHGAIPSAAAQARSDIRWTAFDIRPEFGPYLASQDLRLDFTIRDFISWTPKANASFDVVITNPPYSIAENVIRTAFGLAPTVVMLLRLNYLASAKRAQLMREHPPDVYVLPNRPSFSGRGTDSIEYAWFVWHPEAARCSGRLQVLPPTDSKERARDHESQRRMIGAISLQDQRD